MDEILGGLSQLSRQTRTAIAVFFLLFLRVFSPLCGQGANSVQNSISFVNGRGSLWIVEPFDNQLTFMFSVDSATTTRSILKPEDDGTERWTEIEEDWSLITLFEAHNGTFFKVPFSAPVDWYFRERLARNGVSNFFRLTDLSASDERQRRRRGSFELMGVETGVGRASLNISGNINVSGKMVFQDQELSRSNLRQAQTTHFEFDQRQNLMLEGKVGERVSVLMDMDSERDVDWENQIKINYAGTEDEIVQKIEAGNISLSLPSTQFVTFSGSNQGLFGLKSLMKLGPVDVTALASIEKTRKEKQQFKDGAKSQGQTIPDYQYRKNQYFFVDQLFRYGEESGLLFVPSFYPLKDGKHRIGNVVIKEIEVFKSVGSLGSAGTLNGLAYVNPYFDETQSRWRESNSEDSSYTEGSLFQLLERDVDYVVSEDLGFIRLTTPVQNEILAVSYTLSERDKTAVIRAVGQLTEDVSQGETIHLKLIKPLTPSPPHPTWPLAFKNVYYLGATNINPVGFEVKILYKDGALGNDERDSDGNTFLHLFGLDSLDVDSEPIPDDLIDTYNTNIINRVTGELILPMLHPFELDSLAGTVNYRGEGNQSPSLSTILPDNALMYRSLDYQSIRKESKFDIEATYQNKSATINLGGFMLVEGSEEVYLNDRPLERGKDYTIDYFTGTLTILNEDINDPGAELNILYDKHELVSFDKKTIMGARAQIDLGPNSFIGGTALYYNQSVINEKIEVGYEPTRNFIWDLNGRYESDLDLLTRAIDKLPLIETNKPSSFRVEGEFAQVLPNPNSVDNPTTDDREGVAFIDDFEGAKRTSSPSIRRRFWNFSSTPLGFDRKNRANLFWYNPYTQVRTTDIWPRQEVSTRAQNHLTDILVLNYSRRKTQIGSVDPDSTWGGITASLYSSSYNQSQSKFFEIWLLTDDDIQGRMSVDLGFISEDQNGNREFDTEDEPEAGLSIGNTFLEDDEDIGLDGCEDAYEDGYGGCLDITYEAALQLGYDVYYSDDPDDFDPGDPNGDNWSFDETEREGPEKYRYINGTDGNGTAKRPMEGARYPDTEDINRDGFPDRNNDYFTMSIDLSLYGEDWREYKGGENDSRMGKWRLYRIPLSDFTKVKKDGAITWDTIKFLRLGLMGIPEEAEVKIAKVELVGNEWQERGVRKGRTGPFVPDDSVFAVTVVNTEDNQDYAQSVEDIGVRGEYDRVYGIRKKEQSLVLTFDNLKPGEEGAAQKNLIELRGNKALSYLTYEKMKLFTYGEGDHIWQDSTDVEFFLRFGRGDDFYEIRQPVYEGWDEERKRNFMSIDLGFLTGLKRKDSTNIKRKNPEDMFVVTDSTLEYIATENSGEDTVKTYLIQGRPALSRIQFFEVGVRNKSSTEPVSGEIWLDELRLSHVRKDAGTAVRFQSSLNLADFGNATLTYSRKHADFHVLQQRLGTGQTTERVRVDSRLNLNKFFPQSWGLGLPLSLSYSNNVATPKYYPGTDILLSGDSPPDSALTRSRQVAMSTSFTKSTRSDRWYTRYTLDPLNTSFSTSQTWGSDEQIERRFGRSNTGGAGYGLSFGRDNYWRPLKFLKEVPLLGSKFSDIHLYYTPSSFDMSMKVSEALTETKPRVGESKRVYNLGLSRTFKIGYTILENLKTNYSKSMKSNMNKFENQYLKALKTLTPGIVSDVTDNVSTTFTPTIFTWLKPSLNYSTNYRWSKPIESTQEGANIASQTRFSSSLTLNPKSIIETVYTPSRPVGRGSRRRSRRTPQTVEEGGTEPDKKVPENETLKSVLKTLHEAASRISPISITFSENRSQNDFGVLGEVNLPYRFGFDNELGPRATYSDEVGVNRRSIQRQRDISLRSGLSITPRIRTTVSFSHNRSRGLDGNNISRESITRGFLPSGISGGEGFPFVGWSLSWSGIEKWPLIKMIAKSASFDHAFAGKETRSWQSDVLLSSKYTASYSPVAGFSMTILKGISFSTRFSTVRTVDNRFSGLNSTRVKTDRSWTATSSYAHRGGLHIPLVFFRDFNMENTMNFSLTFDHTQSVTRERNGAEYPLSTSATRKSWKISPRISYSFSRTVTGGVWFEYRESDSRVVGRKVDRDFGFDVNIAIRG
ncbi:MAG: cell surface protein SprA [Candidatus Neomarinimicrobiota bacterium]